MRRGIFRNAVAAAAVIAALLPANASAHDESHGGESSGGSDAFHHMSLVSAHPPSAGTPTTNSDLAFWGARAYAATYHGFRVFDVSGPTPVLLGEMRCEGAQGDPSVWDRDGDGTADLLIQSVDRTMSAPHCGAVPVAHDDRTGWEGLRIFDVADPANMRLIATVYQDCGSHTNTLIPRPGENRLLVLNSSYPLRPGPTCGPVRGPEAGRDPLHGTVQVVEVPLGDPSTAREITELPISYPGDNDNNYLPITEHGINGGSVGGSGLVDGMRACHEIAVFTGAGVAAGACGEQAQMWRLDPLTGLPDTTRPLWVYDQDNVDFWHSATFTWDGEVVVFIDESFGNGCPSVTVKRVRAGQPERAYATGNTFFLDARTGELLNEFRLPRTSQDPSAYCSSHNGSVIPARDRYLYTSGYYSAGTSVVDFSDPRAPREIAYGDRAGSGTWAAYWYEYGDKQRRTDRFRIYASDGVGTPAASHNGFETWDAHLGFAQVVPQQRLNPQLQEDLLRTHVNPRRPVRS